MASVTVDDFNQGSADALIRLWRVSFEYGVGVVDPHTIEEFWQLEDIKYIWRATSAA